MPTQNRVRSVLHNFLKRVSNRNADREGYWIWGSIVEDLQHTPIDLLFDAEPTGTPAWIAFVALARARFREQANKARMMARIRRAELLVQRSGTTTPGEVNGVPADEYEVTLTARAETTSGRDVTYWVTILAARHDPARERRRAPPY